MTEKKPTTFLGCSAFRVCYLSEIQFALEKINWFFTGWIIDIKWFSGIGRSPFGYWICSDGNTKVGLIKLRKYRPLYWAWVAVNTIDCSIMVYKGLPGGAIEEASGHQEVHFSPSTIETM